MRYATIRSRKMRYKTASTMRATPLLLAAGTLLLAPGCFEPALDAETDYVIGGAPTAEGEFPGVGALVYDFGGTLSPGCTGTLIAPDAVLTAAHCVAPDVTGGIIPGFTLVLDANAVTSNDVVPGASVAAHESFDINVEPFDGLGTFYDVGILRLSQPITAVAPVRMPRPDHAAQLAAGLELDIVGYGRTDNGSDAFGVMYDARTALVSLNPTEIQVGMGAPQPQNCNGDSGGPAFAELAGRRLVGIVSRSFSGAECTMGGIDTRVDAYLTWIHEKVATGIPCGSGLAEACTDEEPGEDEGGCCSTGGRGLPGTAALGLLVGLTLLRRRRR